MGLNELIAGLAIGIASALAAHWILQLKYGRAATVGAIFAVVAAAAVSLTAPQRVSSVSGCLEADGTVTIKGRLTSIVFAGPPVGMTVQVKVYEPGRGDPALAGPEYAVASSDGSFSASVAALPQHPGYVVNVAYPFGSLLGEQWEIRDFLLSTLPPCSEKGSPT